MNYLNLKTQLGNYNKHQYFSIDSKGSTPKNNSNQPGLKSLQKRIQKTNNHQLQLQTQSKSIVFQLPLNRNKNNLTYSTNNSSYSKVIPKSSVQKQNQSQIQELLQIILMLKIQNTRMRDHQIQSSQKVKKQIQQLQLRFQTQRAQRKEEVNTFYQEMKQVLTQNRFLLATNDQIKSYCQQLENQNIQLKSKLRQNENQVQQFIKKMKKKNSQYEQLQKNLKNDRMEYDNKVKTFQKNIKKLQSQIEDMQKQLKSYERTQQIKQINQQRLVKQLVQKLKDSQKRIKQEQNQYKMILADLKTQNTNLTRQRRNQQSSLLQFSSQNNQLKSELQKFKTQINEQAENIQNLNDQLQNVENQRQNQLKQLIKQKQIIRKLQDQIHAIGQEKFILQQKNRQLQKNHENLQQQALSIQQKNTKLFKELQKVKQQHRNFQKLFKQSQEQNKTLQQYINQFCKESNSLKQVKMQQQKIIQINSNQNKKSTNSQRERISKQSSKSFSRGNLQQITEQTLNDQSSCRECSQCQNNLSTKKLNNQQRFSSQNYKKVYERQNQSELKVRKGFKHHQASKSLSHQNLQSWKLTHTIQDIENSNNTRYKAYRNDRNKTQESQRQRSNCQYLHSNTQNSFYRPTYLSKSQSKTYRSTQNFQTYNSPYRKNYNKPLQAQVLLQKDLQKNFMFNNEDKQFLFSKLNKIKDYPNCQNNSDDSQKQLPYPIQGVLSQRSKTFRQTPYQACFSQRYNLLKIGNKVKQDLQKNTGLTLNRQKQIKTNYSIRNKQNVSRTIQKKCQALLKKC